MIDAATSRSLQLMARSAVGSVGGYWSPGPAALRVVEEVAELFAEIHNDREDRDLESELADLWIITTCIADQFCHDAAQLYLDPANSSLDAALLRIVEGAGLVARAINYYDGPKTPRSLEGWCSLRSSIGMIHQAVLDISLYFEIDLADAIYSKLSGIETRDKGRFPVSTDPSTSGLVSEFRSLTADTPCPFAKSARLWAGQPWQSDLSIEENVNRGASGMKMFARAAVLEDLDGYVVGGLDFFPGRTFDHLDHALQTILFTLDQSLKELSAEHFDSVGWQFSYEGERMFVSLFSSLYTENHSRYCKEGTFVLFQPEESFTAHGIGGGSPASESLRKSVRAEFRERSILYPTDLVDERREARLYILPDLDQRPRTWWLTR